MLDPVMLDSVITNTDEKLSDISDEQPVLLVFLRHFGCVFCKEALVDLSQLKDKIKSKGVRLIFVHMSENVVAEQYFTEYKLEGATHISDPEMELYREFGITKGSFTQLYGLQTWLRGFEVNKQGHKLELSKKLGDSTQMPGIFLIHRSEIKERYIHNLPSDRPDYMKLLNCCAVNQ